MLMLAGHGCWWLHRVRAELTAPQQSLDAWQAAMDRFPERSRGADDDADARADAEREESALRSARTAGISTQ